MHIVVAGDLKQALVEAGVIVPVAVDEEHPAAFNLDDGLVNRFEYALRDANPSGDKEKHRFEAIVKAAGEVLGVNATEKVDEHSLPSAEDLDAVAEEDAARVANAGDGDEQQQVAEQDPA